MNLTELSQTLTKRPTSWIIVILMIVSGVFCTLYLNQSDKVTEQKIEIDAYRAAKDTEKGTYITETMTIKQSYDSIVKVASALTDSIVKLSWYQKNWWKHTHVTTDSTGHTETVIDEGFTDNGGTSESSVTKSSASTTVEVIKTVYIHDTIAIHDTTHTTETVEHIKYVDKIVIKERNPPGRVYGSVGANVDGSIHISPMINTGFVYSVTKITFLEFAASKSGVIDWGSGYRVGANAGVKLDF